MKGCREKAAVLIAADKRPQTLEDAYKHIQEAIQMRRAILGKKASVKKFNFQESSSSSEDSESSSCSSEQEAFARAIQTKKKVSKGSIKKVLASLARKTDTKGDRKDKAKCFECGEMGHFARDCPSRRSREEQDHLYRREYSRDFNRHDHQDYRQYARPSDHSHFPRPSDYSNFPSDRFGYPMPPWAFGWAPHLNQDPGWRGDAYDRRGQRQTTQSNDPHYSNAESNRGRFRSPSPAARSTATSPAWNVGEKMGVTFADKHLN